MIGRTVHACRCGKEANMEDGFAGIGIALIFVFLFAIVKLVIG